jgi:chromosome segregation ATPase
MMQDNPLGDVPPIESIEPWWPMIGMVVSMGVSAISVGFAAWMKYRELSHTRETKIIDREKEAAIQAEQRKQSVEIEEIKLTFAARQQVVDSLNKQFENLSHQYHTQLEEGRKMREELARARQELRDRDDIIGELRATVAEMQMRIKHLERELDALEKKQSQHEQRYDK